MAGKTQAQWCEIIDGTDVCFAPVLDLDEAPKHPHNAARKTFVEVGGVVQPAPAPRFSRTEPEVQGPPEGSSPDALKIYGEYSGLPDSIVQRVVKLIPKEALQTEQVKDLDGVMADAVTQKFLSAPLTPDQIKELVQVPK